MELREDERTVLGGLVIALVGRDAGSAVFPVLTSTDALTEPGSTAENPRLLAVALSIAAQVARRGEYRVRVVGPQPEGMNPMSEYLLLIYDDESAAAAAGEQESQRLLADHRRFMAAHETALNGGNALESTATATSIRPDGASGLTVTDAPFAETKEAAVGYYLIEAADLDGAVAIAKQVPTFAGGIEVRPVRTFD